jgi:6-bladed beta-propeller protein
MTLRLSLIFLLVAGCGGAEAAKLAQARIDTLPNGTVSVMSDGPTAWSDSSGASLVETARFQGEDGTPAELGQPESIAVDGAGRVYVVDGKPAAIKVFSADGQLIRTVGREGEGPGEFRVGFIAVRGDRLVLHDPRIGRTSVYDTAGTFLKSWNSSCCYWSDIQIDQQNRVYVPSMVAVKAGENPRGTPYVRWSLDGMILDTVWVPGRESGKYWTISRKQGGKTVMSMSTSIPFMPEIASGLHPAGGFVYGWSGEYHIVRSLTGKDSARVFGRAWTPEPVTEERRKAEVESRVKQSAETYGEATVRSAFRLEDIPTTLPAFGGLKVDPDGRVWVRREVADTTRSHFEVFDSTGAYLGPVTTPYQIYAWGRQVWTRDGLIAVIEDEDGRPTVVHLKLELPGRK